MFLLLCRWIIFFSTFISLQAHAEDTTIYVVKEGDQLAQILYEKNLGPIYGPKGLLAKIQKSNSHIPDINRIYPGQKVFLPNEIYRSIAQADPELLKPVTVPVPEPVTPAPLLKLPPAPLLPEKEFNPYTEVLFALKADYIGLDGKEQTNGTQGKLLSRVNKQWEIEWIQHWDEDLQTSVFLGQKYLSFEPEKYGMPLYNSSPELFNLGLSVGTTLSKRWRWRLSADYSQHLFYRGYLGGGSGLELNVLPILSVHPEVFFTILEKKSLKLEALLGVTYYSSTSYDNYSVDAGYGYDLGLQLKQVLKSQNSIYCRISYENRDQNTSLIQLKEQSIGGECGYQWRIE